MADGVFGWDRVGNSRVSGGAKNEVMSVSSTKIVLIVLALCVVLFVVTIVWGVRTNTSKPQPTADNFESSSFFSTLESANQMLDPLAPKLDLSNKEFDLSRATLAAPVRVTIPADENQNYRKATFKLVPEACARIEYKTLDGNGGDLSDQCYPLAQCGKPEAKKDPKSPTFTILKSAGTLTLSHTSPLPLQECVAQLE
jgi:hypothetical protein